MLGNHLGFRPISAISFIEPDNSANQVNYAIKDGPCRRVEMALSTSAGQDLPNPPILSIVAMADLSVVECTSTLDIRIALVVTPLRS